MDVHAVFFGAIERDVRDFFEVLDAAAKAGPLIELQRPATVLIRLGQAGEWWVRVSPTEPGSVVRTEASTGEAADFTLTSSASVLLDLANGRRKPVAALMKGLINARGDKSILPPILKILKAAGEEIRRRQQLQTAPDPAALRAVVHGASVVADARDTFAVYRIQVSEAGAHWTIVRRWSELRSLERRLGKIRPAVKGLPSLPRSLDIAGSLEPSFLAQRARLIESYLSDALTCAAASHTPHPTRRIPHVPRPYLTLQLLKHQSNARTAHSCSQMPHSTQLIPDALLVSSPILPLARHKLRPAA